HALALGPADHRARPQALPDLVEGPRQVHAVPDGPGRRLEPLVLERYAVVEAADPQRRVGGDVVGQQAPLHLVVDERVAVVGEREAHLARAPEVVDAAAHEAGARLAADEQDPPHGPEAVGVVEYPEPVGAVEHVAVARADERLPDGALERIDPLEPVGELGGRSACGGDDHSDLSRWSAPAAARIVASSASSSTGPGVWASE